MLRGLYSPSKSLNMNYTGNEKSLSVLGMHAYPIHLLTYYGPCVHVLHIHIIIIMPCDLLFIFASTKMKFRSTVSLMEMILYWMVKDVVSLIPTAP